MNNINILVVDDDLVNLKLAEIMLKKHSNVGEIIKANNGLEALNVLTERNDINIVLLDIVMPVMNGLEFLDNIQVKEKISKIPVIVLTTDETVKREAFNKGANDFLTKPIVEKLLIEKINKFTALD
ncbi:response regulator [Campylobacter sp. FMV-PI01]|uniref:Response regulator n=1 Tax=Campylobacter portucalensis TaxID=2608384 RepID=A0A6L5WHA6_9BACT|nr:response regulator [Campylobacter portucalensis]MSN95792.1 response regulator [Campylobacter portucalensis]